MTAALAPTAIAAPMALPCPRCGTVMTTHERSGVVVDQCRDCRGFFLDHGELERLVAAEGGAWLGPAPRRPFTPVGDAARYHSEWFVDDRDVAGGH